MVMEGGREPKGRRTGGDREPDERPGRRALFTPATPPTRKARPPQPAPEPTVEVQEPAVPGPDPASLAAAIQQALDDRVPLMPDAFGEAYAPVAAAVGRLLSELEGARSRLDQAAADAARHVLVEAETAAASRRPVPTVRDVPLPALVLGPDLTFREANEGLLALVGVPAGALHGTPLSQFVRRRDGDPPVLALRRKASIRAEVTLDLPAGEARFTEYVSPISGEGGDVEGLVVVYVPETVPPVPEDDGYARLFGALMQEAPLSIALLDASFRVLDHTPALEILLGCDAAWLSTHPLTELPLLEEVGQGLEEIADGGEEAFGEVVIEVDATRHRLERYVLPVRDAEGRLFRLLVTFTDRTEGFEQAHRIVALEQYAAELRQEAGESLAELEQRAAERQRRAEEGMAAFEQRAGDQQREIAEGTAALQLALSRLAEGDLQHRLDPGQGPLAAVRAAYNHAAEALDERFEAAAVPVAEPAPAAPEADGMVLVSAAEITGLLLGALAGERGERLLLDEDDPLMPLRAEVNEALERLEATWSEPSNTDAESSDEATARAPPDRESQNPTEIVALEPSIPPAVDLAVMPAEGPEAEFEPAAEEISLPDSIVEPGFPSPLVVTVAPTEETVGPKDVAEPSDLETHRASAADLGAYVEVVTFEMAGQQYALDIRLAREIVEMIPITPIPRSPSHITGIINLRGEITTILNLYRLLGLPDPGPGEGQKIVVLVPEAAEGSNVGIIVDNVHSVNQVPSSRIELKGEDSSADYTGFVRGIIRQDSAEIVEGNRNLVIWIDMPAILEGLIAQSP